MAVQTVSSVNFFDDAGLTHNKLDLGQPHADKRIDRVWLTTSGSFHTGSGDRLPVLNYTVYRGFALSDGSASGSIEASTEQLHTNQGWIFYMDRNCWGRLIDLDFEFPGLMLRENSLVRPPIVIDYEVLREL